MKSMKLLLNSKMQSQYMKFAPKVYSIVQENSISNNEVQPTDSQKSA